MHIAGQFVMKLVILICLVLTVNTWPQIEQCRGRIEGIERDVNAKEAAKTAKDRYYSLFRC